MSTEECKNASLDKLLKSIKNMHATNNNNTSRNISNICCFYLDKLLVWNEDEQCLYACHLDDQYNISNIQIVTLSVRPCFTINQLSLNALSFDGALMNDFRCKTGNGGYLALYGQTGLMIVELPRTWPTTTTVSNNKQNSNKILVMSYVLAQRMFLCNSHLKIECLRWHPVSRRHLLILTNDNYIRLFDVQQQYEAINTICLNIRNSPNTYFQSCSYQESLGENVVAFDFGPSLAQYKQQQLEPNESLAEQLNVVHQIYVLKENGDILLIYLNMNDLSMPCRTYGPLKMMPAAEDNYGSDACSIICLDCVPPIIVIGTNSGLLYHCIAIENDNDDDEQHTNDNNDQQEQSYRLQIGPNGTHFVMPEMVLYVLEIVQLTFPLGSYQENKKQQQNDIELNTPMNLVIDIKDPKRYFCIHWFGVHVIQVSFYKQLIEANCNEYNDDKCIVEYLICTRPTIQQSDSTSTFPIGMSLAMNYGFTSVTILLNDGQLIHKRLSNVVLMMQHQDDDNEDSALKMLSDDWFKLTETSPNKSQNSSSQNKSSPVRQSNFPQHIQKILSKESSLPLIKSSKPKNGVVGVAELEMLINSIDILRKEYLDKYSLAAKAIEKRKLALNADLQFQQNEITKLKTEKDSLLKSLVEINKKYEKARNMANELMNRLERSIIILQKQRPNLSDAELKLNQDLNKDLNKIESYKEQFEQIKRKQQYQQQQLQQNTIDDMVMDRAYSNRVLSIDNPHMKHIKPILANQGNQIAELMAILTKLQKTFS